MTKITFKKIQTFNAVITLLVLFASFYFQYFAGLLPCPLCIMQRVCVFLLLGTVSLSFRTLQRAHLICVLQIFFASAGLFFALRQLWIQSLPAASMPACMPGLDILIRYFPWRAAFQSLFWGTGDCGEVHWQFLGISMPGWAAMYFSYMFAMGCYLLYRTRLSESS